MTIENNTLVTVLVLLLVVLSGGLQLKDHLDHGREVERAREAVLASKKAVEANRKELAGIERTLRLHVSEERAIVPRTRPRKRR